MHLEEIRRDYRRDELTENNIHQNPFEQFKKWLDEACFENIHDATAMSVASIGCDGFPQSRIVLLKDFGESGFTFFSNYTSEKGKAIEKNNKVSLHFFWSELERQIRITGYAKKTDPGISKKYFHSRPQKSQIAASISEQSAVVPSREYLESKFNKLFERLKDKNPEFQKKKLGRICSKPCKI